MKPPPVDVPQMMRMVAYINEFFSKERERKKK